MGLIRFSFTFTLGAIAGIYAAQNYRVPNVRELAQSYFVNAKLFEETYRKPQKGQIRGETDNSE